MKQKHLGIICTIIIFTAGIVAAYSSGPPDKLTGAPGESTCTCHSIGTNGSVTISTPPSYSAGDTVEVFVDVNQIGQSRWGFELTVLDASDNYVGELLNDDSTLTQLSTTSGRTYIKHREAGTFPGVFDSSPGWTVLWVAPAEYVGTVTFYASGNATNNSMDFFGDAYYTTSTNLSTSDACCVGIRGNVDGDVSQVVDISDLVYLVDFMFTSGPAPICSVEANIDADINGNIDISDLVYLVDFMFTDGPPPPACP